jgi:nicotinate dehydrogenase subunit A
MKVAGEGGVHAATPFELNGRPVEVSADPDTALLYVLRNDLRMTGTRYGCGLEQCGACMVLVDGKSSYACTTPLGAVAGRSVTTVEGIAAEGGVPELSRAFDQLQAVQCGYCVSGIIVKAAELLRANPAPDEQTVRAALDRNLCRCGAHQRMIKAVLSAAESRRG